MENKSILDDGKREKGGEKSDKAIILSRKSVYEPGKKWYDISEYVSIPC